jgi:hypothetical protein
MRASPAVADALRAAAQLLGAAFGGPVRLAPGVPLTPFGNVRRVPLLAGPAGVPPTAIVKLPGGGDWDPQAHVDAAPAWRVFNDWAGLAFLGTLGADPPLAPRLHGGDRATGLLVLEDLGPAATLQGALLDDDPLPAADGLLAAAAALGRLHARTSGRETDYDRLRDPLGPRDRTNEFYGGDYATLGGALRAALAALDLPPAPGTAADLAALAAALAAPGPFHAYGHGDPAPSNWLWVGESLRAVDFEWGGFRHALLDAAAPRMLFPTSRAVGAIPPPLLAEFEATYRAELARGCPAAADDALFRRALVEGCAAWSLARNDWGPGGILDADVGGALATMRQRRIHGFATFAALAAEAGHLAALGATAGRLAAALRQRWGPLDAALPPYPAFA